MLCKTIKKFEHFGELCDEIKNLISSVSFSKKIQNQLAIQVANPTDCGPESWLTSIGRIEQEDKTIVENEYKYIHPALRGTRIHEWLDSLVEYGMVRTRLMVIPPKSCYSIHRDPTPRIHLPIKTNPHCLMCFPDHGVMQYLPANGLSYFVDTTENHTFINCSTDYRLHLVGVIPLKSTVE